MRHDHEAEQYRQKPAAHRVEVVPDGIHEIVSKQQAGWGYIKVAH